MYAPPSTPVLDRLDDLDGRTVRPTDPDWDAARSAWALTLDQRPVAVVQAASARDVVTTVRAARADGLRVAPQSTGHNAHPLGPLDDTILLRTTAMRGVEIDSDRRIVRVEAGALWGEVTDAAAKVGLAALAGSSRGVGVVGYTLGGGVSWFARSHGLAVNQVTAADVVTADGQLRRVDADNDPDLFWAIRGGGGNFGVVTALEFRLFPITEVYAGALFWPIEHAADVLHAWHEITATLPEEVMSVGRLLRFPPLPDVPEPFRGRSLVVVELVAQLAPEVVDELIAPLRALHPEIDTVAPTPVAALGELHMDPQDPVPAVGDGFLVAELPVEALDAYLAVTGPDSGLPLLTTEMRHLGGALSPGRTTAGATSGLDGAILVYSGTIAPDAESARAARTALDAIAAALAPWRASTYFLSFAEQTRDGATLFAPDTYRRLREIKTVYDPTDLIRANHPIPPLPVEGS